MLKCITQTPIPSTGAGTSSHAAAVNDYHVVGTYACLNSSDDLVDVGAGKIKSTHQDLWIRLRPAPKLIDKIRSEWHFAGMLIKFKLEVGVSDDELLRIAEHSLRQSKADLIVANTLEGMHDCAYMGSDNTGYRRIQRHTLADNVVREIEQSKVLKKACETEAKSPVLDFSDDQYDLSRGAIGAHVAQYDAI